MVTTHMAAEAARLWPRLMTMSGIAPDGTNVLAQRVTRTKTLEHLLVHLQTALGRGLVFKMIRRPADPARFAGIVEAQREAAVRLSTHPFARVPAILAVDHAARAMLMDRVPGDTVHALLEDGADPVTALAQAGRWMAAFHDAPRAERRPFRPHYMADHLGHLAEQIVRGEKRVPARAEFLRHVATIRAMAPAFAGRPGLSSVRHGDLHMRNIILAPDHAHGIDFHPPGTSPVGFDIARFLVDYAERLVPIEAIPQGDVVPPAALGAFFSGYDLVSPEDAVVTFLLRVRVLSNWSSLPPSRLAMSLSQMARLARLRAIARKAMDG
ncbi:MAG: aminoglycoside phosphotransferase family protein [Rubellimicrobium sp.]|nr:aminoglycoside phosphotransferase family protein [Rubellimicrobium sp.]